MEITGSCESQWQRPIYSSLDVKKVEEFKKVLEEKAEKGREVRNDIYAALAGWETINPRPQIDLRMKQKQIADSQVKYMEWFRERTGHEKHIRSFYSKEALEAAEIDNDIGWEIEEVPFE